MMQASLFAQELTDLTMIMKTRKDEHVEAPIGRDIAAGEEAESHLDAFIAKRDKQRRKSEGERREEALYAESVKRFNARREREMRVQWATFHREQAARHRAVLEVLIGHHEAQAEKLSGHNNLEKE